MDIKIGNDWDDIIGEETAQPYFSQIMSFLSNEYAAHTVYPPKSLIFASLKYLPFSDVKVVIVGQDPYINEGQANGLAFAVGKNMPLPPSLKNIYKEIESDLGVSMRGKSGELTGWAAQGVLLLNATLTVRAGDSNTHQNCGWQQFTDFLIRKLGNREKPLVFILWGANARRKTHMVSSRHKIIESAHPSPMSATNGFFGSKPFSRTNAFLVENDIAPVDWREVVCAKLPYYYTEIGTIRKA